MKKINISIVLYKNKKSDIKRILLKILKNELINKIYLIDNSPDDSLKMLSDLNKKIYYIFNNKNIGYGAGHNIVLRKTISDNIPYHLVMNPDVYFDKNVIEKLMEYTEKNEKVGLVMPKVLYPNKEIQYLAKLLPTPLDLIFRRFLPFKKYKEKMNEKYELRFTKYNKIINAPSLSGCFMFLKTKILKDIGLFDERYFMYLEDVDLSRRIHKKYKTIFYPKITVIHEYQKASYKNIKMLSLHIISAIKYFNKWGWIFDKERVIVNENTIKNINE